MQQTRWRKQGLVNQAARDLRPARIPDTTTRARFTTDCVTCEKTISVGEGIALIRIQGKRFWRHATCALPSSPGTTASPS